MSDQRTLPQNSAFHLYFTQLAEELNDAGLHMRKVLKEEFEISWTAENVKNCLWRPIQQALLQKDSTTELTTDEVNKVYELLNRNLAEKFGIVLQFPDRFNQWSKK